MSLSISELETLERNLERRLAKCERENNILRKTLQDILHLVQINSDIGIDLDDNMDDFNEELTAIVITTKSATSDNESTTNTAFTLPSMDPPQDKTKDVVKQSHDWFTTNHTTS